MTQKSLLTVLLNYKTAEMTLEAATTAIRAMEGITGEIVIVDNDSQDGSYELMSREATARGWTKNNRVRVVESGHNGGFGAGNNFGIRQGLSTGDTPDFVYLLNSDAFVDPGAIKALMDFMIDHPKAGFVGSGSRGEDDVPHTTQFRFPSIAGEFEDAIKLGLVTRALKNSVVPMLPCEQPMKVDWVAGSSLMMRTETLQDIGLFDETYFLYFEETDLCIRGHRAGWETWAVPQSTVMHIGSVSTGKNGWTRAPRYWFDSRRHYFLKNHGRVYLALTGLARVVGGTLWRIRRLIHHRQQTEPQYFLWDFICHGVTASLSGQTPARRSSNSLSQSASSSQRFAKDNK